MGVGMAVFYKRMSRHSPKRSCEMREVGPFPVQQDGEWPGAPQDVHGLAHYATKS